MEIIGNGSKRNTCKTCEYFERQIDKNDVSKVQGACKRYPPVSHPFPSHGGQIAVMNILPTTAGSDWCGEWAAPVPRVDIKQ